jgi:hypothetical protein
MAIFYPVSFGYLKDRHLSTLNYAGNYSVNEQTIILFAKTHQQTNMKFKYLNAKGILLQRKVLACIHAMIKMLHDKIG